MLPGYQTYQDEMIHLGHGFPVWDADPYDGQEIQIGDLGYMDEGAFRCIRRLSSPYDTSRAVQQRIDLQTPLLSQSNLQEQGVRAAGGVETPALAANSVGRALLPKSRNAFAVLSVEQGYADFLSCHEVAKHTMGQEFLQNAHSWLRDAATAGIVPADFPVGRLILVTGFYKTWNWAAIAMSSESSGGGLGLGGGGLSDNWNNVRQVSPAHSSGHHHRSRSVTPAIVTTPPTSELFARCCRDHDDVRNQCIFLRGFRYRERMPWMDELEVMAPPLDGKPPFFQRGIFRRTPKPTSTPAFGPPAVPPKAPSDESAPQQKGCSAHVEPISGLPDPDACDALYDAVALEKFTQEKDLSTVVVHDDELIARLERHQSGKGLQDPKLVGHVNAERGDDKAWRLHAASARGHEVIAKLLLEKGPDVNAQ